MKHKFQPTSCASQNAFDSFSETRQPILKSGSSTGRKSANLFPKYEEMSRLERFGDSRIYYAMPRN